MRLWFLNQESPNYQCLKMSLIRPKSVCIKLLMFLMFLKEEKIYYKWYVKVEFPLCGMVGEFATNSL